MFRRRGRESADSEPVEESEDGLEIEAVASADVLPVDEPGAPQGPWDSSDVPEDGVERLDLGGMQVPVLEGVELRVDVSPEGQVIAATLVAGDSAMQVNAFAAPRTAGIWSEVCDEIVESLQAGGGSADREQGPFGLELRAMVPQEVPGAGVVLAPARFLGADGPRWFLRALLSGPAVTDPAQGELFEQLFRAVVVVRGKDAMAPRDPLPLRLPTDALVSGDPEADADAGDLNPFERGPEITEIH